MHDESHSPPAGPIITAARGAGACRMCQGIAYQRAPGADRGAPDPTAAPGVPPEHPECESGAAGGAHDSNPRRTLVGPGALRSGYAGRARGGHALRRAPIARGAGEHARLGPPVVDRGAHGGAARRSSPGGVARPRGAPADTLAELSLAPIARAASTSPRRGPPALRFPPSAITAIACTGAACAAPSGAGLTFRPFSRNLRNYGK